MVVVVVVVVVAIVVVVVAVVFFVVVVVGPRVLLHPIVVGPPMPLPNQSACVRCKLGTRAAVSVVSSTSSVDTHCS